MDSIKEYLSKQSLFEGLNNEDRTTLQLIYLKKILCW